jgi:serine/threonine protein phosphatase PrpC
MNQLRHARRGQFAVRAVKRLGVPGLEIVAADLGEGIADPRRALAGIGPSPTSLGAGVPGARRMTDEMDIDVRWGEGTLVRARVFAERLPRRREVGILGRPYPGERVSGDQAIFAREGATLVCALADGVGHGPLARDAAALAVQTALADHERSPARILEGCDAALLDTRGAVMAVARLDEDLGTVEHAAIGNITTRIEGFAGVRVMSGTAATLGRRGPARPKPAVETVPLVAHEALIMLSDGLTTRVSLADHLDLLREHPIVIAQHILETFVRATDDALVLVAR